MNINKIYLNVPSAHSSPYVVKSRPLHPYRRDWISWKNIHTWICVVWQQSNSNSFAIVKKKKKPFLNFSNLRDKFIIFESCYILNNPVGSLYKDANLYSNCMFVTSLHIVNVLSDTSHLQKGILCLSGGALFHYILKMQTY